MKQLIIVGSILIILTGCAAPKKISQIEQGTFAKRQIDQMYNFTPTEPMSLAEVISTSMLRNQDGWTKKYEAMLAEEKRLAANLDLLPQVAANLRRTERDKLALSTSARLGEDPIDGVDTTPSYSSPKSVEARDLRINWNVTNLAVNVLTTKQVGNHKHIAELNKLRAQQNIFSDVFPAYHLAAINQKEGQRMVELKDALKASVDDVCRNLVSTDAINEALADQCTAALNAENDLNQLISQLNEADINLHSLMTVKPDVPIRLIQPTMADPGALKLSKEKLVELALSHRPELGIEMYKIRNAKLDKKKAWLDVLPDVEIGVSRNRTDNDFIVNKSWQEDSLNVSWNLLSKVIGAPLRASQAKYKHLAAQSRFRGLTIAVISQVEQAYDNYQLDRDVFLNSHKKHLISIKKTNQLRAQMKNGQISKMTFLENEIKNLLAEMQLKADYARVATTLGMLYSHIGVPLLPMLEQAQTPSELTRLISQQLSQLSIIDGGA